jgi:uncharacterized membrane protein YwzB
MPMAQFYVRAGIYAVMFLLSFFSMGALDFSRFLKQGHTAQAQVLYWILVLSLAYLSGSFIISFLYV